MECTQLIFKRCWSERDLKRFSLSLGMYFLCPHHELQGKWRSLDFGFLGKHLATALGATPNKIMKVTAMWKYRSYSEISSPPTDTQPHKSFMEAQQSVQIAVIAGSQPCYCFSVIQVISAAFMAITAWWSHKKKKKNTDMLSLLQLPSSAFPYTPGVIIQLWNFNYFL